MDITVTFMGNATTLITAGGLTLLTDPNFLHRGQHAYLGYGLVSKRPKEPALSIDELRAIDAIVLSHMHGDHWDRCRRRALTMAFPSSPRGMLPNGSITVASSTHSVCRRGSITQSARAADHPLHVTPRTSRAETWTQRLHPAGHGHHARVRLG